MKGTRVQTIKRHLKSLWSVLFAFIVNTLFKKILAETYRSEIIFFQTIRYKNYDDIKYLEQQLRLCAHHLDKLLTLDTFKEHAGIAKRTVELIENLQSKDITDSPTVKWAQQILQAYNQRLSSQDVLQSLPTDGSSSCHSFSKDSIADLIKTRRSIRSFRDEPVPRETINAILEMGLWAPSGCNRQNTEYLILDQAEDIRFCQRIAGEGHNFPQQAAWSVVILLDCRSYALPSQRHQAYLEAGAAIQNMLLYAHALNIGSIWLNWQGVERSHVKLRERFGLTDWLLPVAMLCFGYTKVPPPVVPYRKLLQDAVQYTGSL